MLLVSVQEPVLDVAAPVGAGQVQLVTCCCFHTPTMPAGHAGLRVAVVDDGAMQEVLQVAAIVGLQALQAPTTEVGMPVGEGQL